jgi:hypothetical protein
MAPVASAAWGFPVYRDIIPWRLPTFRPSSPTACRFASCARYRRTSSSGYRTTRMRCSTFGITAIPGHSRKQTISFKSFKGIEPIAARQARFPQRSVRVVSDPLLASAAGLRCGTRARLLGKPRGMLSADSGVVTEMPDGAPYADLMLVPAGGMVLRRMRPAGPSTLPA